MKSSKHLRIAIDGESGSGKSYASRVISKKYKCHLINSGLAYRYASYLVIKHKPKKIIPFSKKNLQFLNIEILTK
jgi:Cytidylate kinase